jgi:signal transduction histidine kinase
LKTIEVKLDSGLVLAPYPLAGGVIVSLRSRLFLLLGSILLLLGGAQWRLVQVLTRDLTAELESVASKVGKEVAGFALRIQKGRDADPVSPAQMEKLMKEGKLPGMVTTKIIRSGPGKERSENEEEVRLSPGTPEGKEPHQRVIVKNLRVESGPASGADPVWTSHSILPGKPGDRLLFVAGPNFSTLIPIEEAGVKNAILRFQRNLFAGSVLILGIGFLAAAFVADRITSPVRELARAARQVENGAVGLQIRPQGGGEAREAVEAFNKMSARLQALEEQALEVRERQHLSELGEVARGLAHALRNPLHALSLSIDELASGTPEETAADELRETARRQIRNLDHSIRSFLAFANGGGGVEEEIDAVSLIQDVVLSSIQDARGRVSIRLDVPNGRIDLTAVPAELRAALQALLVNAVDASPDGSTIDVSVRSVGRRRVVFGIEDRGGGLPSEVRSRLFTPHLTTKSHGSGMGLFLTHRLAVTRYAGSLTLSDREGGGTVAALDVTDRTGGANE